MTCPPSPRTAARAAFSLTLPLLAAVSCSNESAVARLPASPPAPAAQGAPGASRAQPAQGPASASAPAEKSIPSATQVAPPPDGSFLSAQTEAHRRSTLTPKVSSTVTAVHVRDGDVVKAGQALVTLDTQDFRLRVEQAEAARRAAQVQLDSAKLDWNRSKTLLADKAVPQAQYDAMDARLKGAQAGLAQADVALAMARKALRDATIYAPFSGIVVKRLVNEGEYASVMPATPLVIIEEVDPLDLRIQLPAPLAAMVRTGDRVKVRFPATGQTIEVALTRVVAALDPHSRTFSAVAELANHDHALRSGLYAEVVLASPPPASPGTSLAARSDKPAPPRLTKSALASKAAR